MPIVTRSILMNGASFFLYEKEQHPGMRERMKMCATAQKVPKLEAIRV